MKTFVFRCYVENLRQVKGFRKMNEQQLLKKSRKVIVISLNWGYPSQVTASNWQVLH